MSDAFKLHQSLIHGYEKAFLHKNGQAVQQEVAKVWRGIKTNCKTRTELTAATEKQLAEWKQIELKKKGSLLSFWSKVIFYITVYDQALRQIFTVSNIKAENCFKNFLIRCLIIL